VDATTLEILYRKAKETTRQRNVVAADGKILNHGASG
jgi:hypothetical protein